MPGLRPHRESIGLGLIPIFGNFNCTLTQWLVFYSNSNFRPKYLPWVKSVLLRGLYWPLFLHCTILDQMGTNLAQTPLFEILNTSQDEAKSLQYRAHSNVYPIGLKVRNTCFPFMLRRGIYSSSVIALPVVKSDQKSPYFTLK